jgi:MFS family permease
MGARSATPVRGALRSILAGVDRPLAILSAAGFIGQTGVAVMLPLLPLYAHQLGASPFVLGLLTSGFAVANTVAQLVVGFLSDRFGARRMLPTGLGIYAAANGLIAAATSAVPLVAFRSLAGFGGGMAIVAERIYLARVSAGERLAFANGVLSAAQSAGTVTGPALAGILAAASDLRVPFVLVAVTSLMAFGGTLLLPREPARPGTLPDPAGGVDAVIDLAPPPVPLRPLAALLVANLALQAAFGAFITTYAPYATERLDWSTAQVGIVFALFGAGSILLGPWLARLADRRGRRPVAIAGVVPVIVWAPLLLLGLPDPVIFLGSIIAGGGLTAFTASWYALLSDASPAGRQGRTFGFVSAISTLGIIAGAMGASFAWERVDLSVGLLVSSLVLVPAIPALLALPDRAVGLAGHSHGAHG